MNLSALTYIKNPKPISKEARVMQLLARTMNVGLSVAYTLVRDNPEVVEDTEALLKLIQAIKEHK